MCPEPSFNVYPVTAPPPPPHSLPPRLLLSLILNPLFTIPGKDHTHLPCIPYSIHVVSSGRFHQIYFSIILYAYFLSGYSFYICLPLILILLRFLSSIIIPLQLHSLIAFLGLHYILPYTQTSLYNIFWAPVIYTIFLPLHLPVHLSIYLSHLPHTIILDLSTFFFLSLSLVSLPRKENTLTNFSRIFL